jgi:hypothetical protein
MGLLVMKALRMNWPLWATGALLALTVALAVLVWWFAARPLNHLETRDELSSAVSAARGWRRMSLVWYEYVIARNIVRGTYNGEPPTEFKDDVYEASMNMTWSTRHARRQTVWGLAGAALFTIVVSVAVGWGDSTVTIVLLGIFAGVFVLTAAVTALAVWSRSRSPRSKLGRLVEDACPLPSDERWERLLEIARTEVAMSGPA